MVTYIGVTYLFPRYYTVTSEVLTSVKKMEDSLKRLKKVRGTDKGQGSTGMSDDDKIRQQLILDINSFGEQVSGHPCTILFYNLCIW